MTALGRQLFWREVSVYGRVQSTATGCRSERSLVFKIQSGKYTKKSESETDWAFNTIWFDQISDNKKYFFDWKQGQGFNEVNRAELEYLTVWHQKSREKNFSNMPPIDSLKYLKINWSNSTSLNGLTQFPGLKRLELHYCTKIETTNGIASLSNSMGHLHINMSKKLKITEELSSLTQLRVLRLNSCGDIDSLDFLKYLPNLLDFRFVNTNVLDGNLKPIVEHLTVCSAGFSSLRFNRFAGCYRGRRICSLGRR